MKKTVAALIVILIMPMFFVHNASADRAGDPFVDRTVRIGVNSHLPPFSYVDDNGIPKGFNIDIIRAAAIEAGIDIEIYSVPSYKLDEALRKKEIDAVIGTSEGYDSLEFLSSDLIIKSSDIIFVRKDNKFIIEIDDLKNVETAIYSASLTPRVLSMIEEYDGSSNIKIIDSQQQGIAMLMNGQADAFIGDKTTGLYTIQNWNQENFIKTVGDDINENNYKLIARKEEEELIKLYNDGLRQVRSNETYEKIYQKWFGETVDSYRKKLNEIMFFLGALLVVVLIVVYIIFRWNATLKKEVKKRTQEIDIANYKLIRQKAKLEYNDKFKEEIINGVLSGIITIDKAEKVTSINANGLSILKVQKSSILGRDYSETALANLIDKQKMENVLLKGNHYKNQVVESYENGDIRTYEYSITPLMNEDGAVNGTIVSFNDISREVKLREELARGDKMKSLGLMVAGFAHEIRNPLTSIKAMTDIMNKKIEDRNFRDKFTEIVPKEINRLDKLIIELLEFSKPRKADIQIVEIREIIDSIYVLFNEKIKEKNIDFIVGIDQDVKVYADKQQIKQVLINLILNSIESIPENGEIKIFEKRLGDKTEILIEDNGKGISPDNLKKIMDPFFTTKNNGTGLGLFICYQIVKKNNGDISIRSKLGQGTSVSIVLLSPEERSIHHA